MEDNNAKEKNKIINIIKSIKEKLEKRITDSKKDGVLKSIITTLSAIILKIREFVVKLYYKITNKEEVKITMSNDNINQNDKDGNVASDTFVKSELSDADIAATTAAEEEIKNKKNKRKNLIKTIISVVIGIIIFILIIVFVNRCRAKSEETKEIMKKVQQVRKMNISSELSGSGTLSPKDSYTITSLVEGEVIGVYFEQGDVVKKGQLLIEINSQSAYRTINTASTSLAQAKDNYAQAKYEYEKLEKDYEGKTFKAPYSGYFRTLKVKDGDTISNNTEIGTIVNDKLMTLKVPFINSDASRIKKNQTALLEIQETGEYIQGIVDSVSEESQTASSGALVKYVTFSVTNPGGLTTNNTAKAIINGMVSQSDASFTIDVDETITFSDGNNVLIEKMLIEEGAYVEKGTPVFLISDDTFINVINSKKSSYNSAKDSLTRAETTYDNALDDYEEYYITAPIDGTVIKKNAKVGDKIQKNTSSATTLAIIYDLSELTFDMSIDELDISNVEVGQSVEIEADAFNNVKFKGEVTNISLVSENSNGVTNYPVTVTITDVGNLLPGMNVDGYVILSQSDDALVIPADALQRGNVVYVLNSSETIKSKDYSTEGISDRVKNNAPSGFTAIKVTTGISNENFIEILSGLQEGDSVYVTESSSNNTGFGFGGMGGPPGGGMGGGPR